MSTKLTNKVTGWIILSLVAITGCSTKSPLLPKAFIGKWAEIESFVEDSKVRGGKSQFIIKANSITWKREIEGKEIYTAEKLKVENEGKNIIFATTESAGIQDSITGERPRVNIDVTLSIKEGKLIATIRIPPQTISTGSMSITSLESPPTRKIVYER